MHKDWNKKVVVICDQGLGNHIQFIRYLPFLLCEGRASASEAGADISFPAAGQLSRQGIS